MTPGFVAHFVLFTTIIVCFFIIRDMIKEQLDGAGIKLSSDEHVIVEINPDDEYVIDGIHKALVLR